MAGAKTKEVWLCIMKQRIFKNKEVVITRLDLTPIQASELKFKEMRGS